MEVDGFTDEDLKEGESYPSLGPEYFASRRVAEGVMAKFEPEHFKPLIDEFIDKFRERLWDDVRDNLIDDTEQELGSAVSAMVEGTIRALLTGDQWAMNRYPYCDYRDGEKIRKAIAEHSGDEIAARRIADLEKQVAQLEDSLGHYRRGF